MTIAKLLKHDFTKGHLKLYDSNGYQTYYESSKGYWVKSVYDTNGKRTYFENSTGSWYKSEYDTNGNEIYYKTSDGTIEDNRPKANSNGKTVIIDGIEYELKEKK